MKVACGFARSETGRMDRAQRGACAKRGLVHDTAVCRVRIRTLIQEQWLPVARDKVFAFFADAGNLDAITPPWLHFQVVTPQPMTLQAGAVIDYRLRVHGLPMPWQSEITIWEPPHRFVDVQRRGPYRR